MILRPPRHAHEAVLVHRCEIARLDALSTHRIDAAVLHQVADSHLRPADRHLAFHARRTAAAVAVDDLEFLVHRRQADGAHPPLVVPVAADPARFRHAVELQQRDAVHLLELLPLVGGERRGGARHQPQRRQVFRGVSERLVEQHVDDGGHARRERDAVLLDPLEEAAVREAPRDVHRQPLLQERQEGQDLREFQPNERYSSVRSSASSPGCRACRAPTSSTPRDRRPRSSASTSCPTCRRHNEVLRRIALRHVAWPSTGRDVAEIVVLRIARAARAPRTEADQRRARSLRQRRAVELLVIEHQLRLDRLRQLGDVPRVELDVERADHRAHPPRTEPDDQLLQRLVGEQQHAVALRHAALLQVRRHVRRKLVELAERDRRAVLIEIDDRGLRRKAACIVGEQVRYRLEGQGELMVAEGGHGRFLSGTVVGIAVEAAYDIDSHLHATHHRQLSFEAAPSYVDRHPRPLLPAGPRGGAGARRQRSRRVDPAPAAGLPVRAGLRVRAAVAALPRAS